MYKIIDVPIILSHVTRFPVDNLTPISSQLLDLVVIKHFWFTQLHLEFSFQIFHQYFFISY